MRKRMEEQSKTLQKLIEQQRESILRLEQQWGGRDNLVAAFKQHRMQHPGVIQPQNTNNAPQPQTQTLAAMPGSAQMPPQNLPNRQQMQTPQGNASVLPPNLQQYPGLPAHTAPTTASQGPQTQHDAAQKVVRFAAQQQQNQQAVGQPNGQDNAGQMSARTTAGPLPSANIAPAVIPPVLPQSAVPSGPAPHLVAQQAVLNPAFSTLPSAQQAIIKNQLANINNEVNRVLQAASPKTFMKSLFDMMQKRGTEIRTVPRVEGREVDLFQLYKSVQRRGGSIAVRLSSSWPRVAVDVGLITQDFIASDAPQAMRYAETLSSVYRAFLEPFEDNQRRVAYANVMKVQSQGDAASQPIQPMLSDPAFSNVPPMLNNPLLSQQQQTTQNQNMNRMNAAAKAGFAQNMQLLQQQQQNDSSTALVQSTPQLSGPNNGSVQIQHHPSAGNSDMPSFGTPLMINSVQLAGNFQSPQQQSGGSTPQRLSSLGQMAGNGSPMLNRPGIMPTQEELDRARAAIYQIKHKLETGNKRTSSRQALKSPQADPADPAAYYSTLDASTLDRTEIEAIVTETRQMAPLVDKIVELLPLYLAISGEKEGARRLMIMVSVAWICR